MNDHISTKPQKKGWKKYKGWILGLIILSIVTSLVCYNKTIITLYYAQLKYQPFKKGDKIYLNSHIVNAPLYKSFKLHFYKKIRPVNEDDIDDMKAELWQKALIKKSLNTSSKSYLEENAWGINVDSLCKYKTACIGTYVGFEIQYLKYKGKYYRENFLVIKPNKQGLYKDSDQIYSPPNTYVEDEESVFYVNPAGYNLLDNKESKTFRKIN